MEYDKYTLPKQRLSYYEKMEWSAIMLNAMNEAKKQQEEKHNEKIAN